MSCYHPNIVHRFVDSYTGELKSVWRPDSGLFAEGDDIPVPCGKCIGCRLDFARHWSDRMLLELDHSKVAVFATLTYDNEHLPFVDGVPSLSKRDCQLFFKRLRKYFSDKKIRYYLSGEYGSHTFRPHYHSIIFGLSVNDFFDRCIIKHDQFDLFSSDILSSIWEKGFCSFSEVSYNTCNYVARYTLKKIFLDSEKEFPVNEFSLVSRKPGIGGFFYEDHPELFSDFDHYSNRYYVSSYGDGGSKQVVIPKYVLAKLEEVNPELYEVIKSSRMESARSLLQASLSGSDLDVVSYVNRQEQDKLRLSKKMNQHFF